MTEEQAKMMVDCVDEEYEFYKDYTIKGDSWNTATSSFKSLMQYLQVYEVNPYSNPVLGDCMSDWPFGLPNYLEDEYFKWQEAEACIGKWIVLFKPND